MTVNYEKIASQYLTLPEIQSLLQARQASEISVNFLAQGEYNINFLLESPCQKAVLRLNTGSQMHLENQIRYEYRTLEILKQTGVTPSPLYCDDTYTISPYGILLMEHIPGHWLEYEKDFLLAADLFATIHRIKYSDNSDLIVATKPATEILAECQKMANVYLASPVADQKIKKLIRHIIQKVAGIVAAFDEPFDIDRLVLNNTEVNSSNFLLNESTGELKLVDWEKAVFSVPTQDLSHFLVPTTTFWKTDFFFSADQVDQFLKRYCQQANISVNEIKDQLHVFWNVTCLRGVTWCAMAYIEYQQPERPLKNEFAYRKIKNYIEENFIRKVFKDIL